MERGPDPRQSARGNGVNSGSRALVYACSLSSSTLPFVGNWYSKFMGSIFQWSNVGSFIRSRLILLIVQELLPGSHSGASTDLPASPPWPSPSPRWGLGAGISPSRSSSRIALTADYRAEFAGIWLVIITDFLCDLIPLVATATA